MTRVITLHIRILAARLMLTLTSIDIPDAGSFIPLASCIANPLR